MIELRVEDVWSERTPQTAQMCAATSGHDRAQSGKGLFRARTPDEAGAFPLHDVQEAGDQEPHAADHKRHRLHPKLRLGCQGHAWELVAKVGGAADVVQHGACGEGRPREGRSQSKARASGLQKATESAPAVYTTPAQKGRERGATPSQR